MRVISLKARPPMSRDRLVVAEFFPQRRCQRGGHHLWQVTDPRAETIMTFRVHRYHTRSDRLQQLNVFLLKFV